MIANSLTGEFVLKCGYLCLVHVNCLDIFLFHIGLCYDKVMASGLGSNSAFIDMGYKIHLFECLGTLCILV